MTGEHLSKEKLQRHYDGDLSQQEAAAVQQHLSTCPQCEAELAALGRLGNMLRWSSDDATAAVAVDFNHMFAQIERAVADEQDSNVRQLQPRASKASRSRVLPTLGAVALAAAAVLMLTRKENHPNDAPVVEQLAFLDSADHAEVTAVKFGTNAGQVFGIALSDRESVPVVWIDDDDDDNDQGEPGDPGEPGNQGDEE
jgi:anti-sigma factor RsiW